MLDYVKILNDVEKIIKDGADRFLSQAVQSFSHKTVNDILTDVDLKMQKHVVDGICALYPTAHVIAEENDVNSFADGLVFCVDPLDGTCNYSAQIPLFGVQVAVLYNKAIMASVIYLPRFKSVYKAIKGQGVWHNDQPFATISTKNQADSVLLISDFYPGIAVDLDKQYALVKNLQKSFLKTRLFGAACYDFVALATRQASAYVCYYHEIWDIAPGLLLVQELGFVVEGLQTKSYGLGDCALVVGANQSIVNHIKEQFDKL